MRISPFRISLEKELLAKFDRLIEDEKYTNRSEALRDLIREKLVKKSGRGVRGGGAITLV